MIHPVMFRSLWAYRGFVWSSVLREFNGKYRESLFGAFWSVANPLSMIIVYTVIFSQLMRATLPGQEQVPFAFSIYLCAGVITWGLFAEMLARLTTTRLRPRIQLKPDIIYPQGEPILSAKDQQANTLVKSALFA